MPEMMNLWDNVRTLLTGTFSLASTTLNAISALIIMSCFLGHYVKLSRKGVLVMSAFFWCFTAYNVFCFTARFFVPIAEANVDTTLDVGLLFYLFVFVVSIFLYDQKKSLRVLYAFETVLVLWLSNEFLIAMLFNLFGIIDGNPALVISRLRNATDPLGFRFYMVLALFSLSLLLIFYFGFYRKGLFLRLRAIEIFFFAVWIFFMSFFAGLVTGDYSVVFQRYSLALMIPLLSIFFPILFLMNRYRSVLRDKTVYQQTYLDAELAYVDQYKKTQTQTRAFRHDMINQLSLLDMLMNEGKTAEAKEQLEQLLGEIKDLSPKYVTGDQMLDCIVAMKAAKMEELGIRFTVDGVVDGGLHMKPMDVCSVFANALDNAIEAVTNLKEQEDRWVDLQIKRTGQFFVIRISNGTEQKVNLKKLFEGGYTSKKDSEHHGFGLANIRSAVERYDGLVKAESEEKRFSLSVMIARQREDNAKAQNLKEQDAKAQDLKEQDMKAQEKKQEEKAQEEKAQEEHGD